MCLYSSADPTLTVENVTGVMECVSVDRKMKVWSEPCLIPSEQLEEIYQKYSTEEQRVHACVDYYVNHPIIHSSWADFCQRLYLMKEIAAARKAKDFIQPTGRYFAPRLEQSTEYIQNVLIMSEASYSVVYLNTCVPC